GFLINHTTVVQYLSLALHLKSDGLLNGLQGVDVLGFGTGAEFLLADRAQGQVGVDTQRTLIQAAVGHAERLNQIAQCGDISLSDLWSASASTFDWLGDNLNQRDARTVAVHQRSGCAVNTTRSTTQVGELSGVFLHVSAFDFHTP